MPPKVREVLKQLHDEGWFQDRQKGSHRQMKHPSRPGLVTVAGQLSETIPPKTWKNIQEQAGWKK